MSEQAPVGRDRLHELLADRAVFGLDIEEEQELRELLDLHPDVDAEALDRLATLLDVTACASDLPPPPPAVVARILSQAPHTAPVSQPSASRWRLPKRELLAWMTAAACLLIAVYFWVSRDPHTPTPTPGGNPGPIAKQNSDTVPADPQVVPTLLQQREELLVSSDEVLHVRFGAAVDPNTPHVSGDIVWSPTQQRGFLRIKGLPSNDPAKSQYQLWLVEATPMRSETVNAGVFDVDRPSRQLIVPIRAEHFVQQPNIFVVSIEPPGGSPDLTVSGYPLVAKLDDAPR